jgi:DNA-binding transcriptional MerR regulator/integrase
MSKNYSMKQVVEQINVSDSQIYKYCDEFNIEPLRTKGGHRRFTKEQLEKLIEINSKRGILLSDVVKITGLSEKLIARACKMLALSPERSEGNTRRFTEENIQSIIAVKDKLISGFGLPSYEEMEKKYGKLIPYKDGEKYFDCSKDILKVLLQNGYYKEYFLEVGIDMQQHNSKSHHSVKFWFIESLLKKGLSPRNSLIVNKKEIAVIFNIANSTLSSWIQKGYLDAGRVKRHNRKKIELTSYYDLMWVRNNIERIKNERKEANPVFNPGIREQNRIFDMCSLEQKDFINDYCEHRKAGRGIRVGGTTMWKKKIDKPEKNIPLIQQELGSIFYKIICGRTTGINNYWVLDHPGYRKLTEEEQRIYNPSVFKIYDINPTDIHYVQKGYSEPTLYSKIHNSLKPFLYYALQKLKHDITATRQKLTFGGLSVEEKVIVKNELVDLREKYDVFEETIEAVLNETPQEKPEALNPKVAVHLSREMILKAYKNIRYFQLRYGRTGGRIGFEDTLKRATMFMIGCFTGIRNDELANLRITNFELINETKLLKRFKYDELTRKIIEVPDTDVKGFGILRITYSKGSYGPSPTWGTYIAPRLVSLVNEYLEQLYVKYPQGKGLGFLFRSDNKNPDKPYDNQICSWISKFRDNIFDFIPENIRKDITYYDSRHTAADLIVNQTLINDSFLLKHVDRVAELHIRHDMKKKAKSTLRRNYAASALEHEYFQIIQKTFDFPWDVGNDIRIGEYYIWAYENGLAPNPKSENVKFNFPIIEEVKAIQPLVLTNEEREKLQKLNLLLAEKQELFEAIKTGPKKKGQYKMSDEKWIELVAVLPKEITSINEEINRIEFGEAVK